jgi:ABC-type lipoprotein release transport system permease subunit
MTKVAIVCLVWLAWRSIFRALVTGQQSSGSMLIGSIVSALSVGRGVWVVLCVLYCFTGFKTKLLKRQCGLIELNGMYIERN